MKFLALLLLPALAQAGTAALSWNAVTQNTDGSTITGAVTYSVYAGTCGLAVKPQLTTGVSALSYTATGLADGTTVCFNVTANVPGELESAYSNEASKVIPQLQPKPPTGLTVGAATAYSPTPALNKYNMKAVGKVKNGTRCIPTQEVNGLYVVDRSAVQWSGTARPSVVVAECDI